MIPLHVDNTEERNICKSATGKRKLEFLGPQVTSFVKKIITTEKAKDFKPRVLDITIFEK